MDQYNIKHVLIEKSKTRIHHIVEGKDEELDYYITCVMNLRDAMYPGGVLEMELEPNISMKYVSYSLEQQESTRMYNPFHGKYGVEVQTALFKMWSDKKVMPAQKPVSKGVCSSYSDLLDHIVTEVVEYTGKLRDGWGLEVHSRGSEFTSKNTGSVWIRVGEVNACEFDSFLVRFHEKLAKAVQNKVLLDALKPLDDSSVTKPQCGMTDVGLHTGGKPRNTAWPLVVAMTEVLIKNFAEPELDPDLAVFERLMIDFDLSAFGRLIAESGDAMSQSMINICMVVLKAAVDKVAAMALSDFDVQDLEKHCAVMRRRLDDLVDAQSVKLASTFDLPELVESELVVRDITLTFSVNETVSMSKPVASMDSLRKSAEVNLESIPLLVNVADAPDLLAFIRKLRLLKSTDANVILMTTTERAVRHFAASLTQFVPQEFGIADVATRVKCLNAIKVMYAIKRTRPIMQNCGVALRGDDLRHLVLSDKGDIDTALIVFSYLKSETTSAPLFSLRERESLCTFAFAEQFVAQDDSIQAKWRVEQTAAAARQESHWNEVLAKKTEVHASKSFESEQNGSS
eukprot:gene30825-38103_t